MGERVHGSKFSVELSEGWVPIYGYRDDKVFKDVTRDFILVRAKDYRGDDASYDDVPRIMYSGLEIGQGTDAEGQAKQLLSIAIPEYYQQLIRHQKYENALGATLVDDWVAQDRDHVARVSECMLMFGGAREFYVDVLHPLCTHSLRFVLGEEGGVSVDEARELALSIARTLELDDAEPFGPMRRLDEFATRKVSQDEYLELALSIGNQLVMARNERLQAEVSRLTNRVKVGLEQLQQDTSRTVHRCMALGMNEANKAASTYFARLVDVLEAQTGLGATAGELGQMCRQLCDVMGQIIADHFESEDAELQDSINSFGLIEIPDEARALLPRLEAMCPGVTQGMWAAAGGASEADESASAGADGAARRPPASTGSPAASPTSAFTPLTVQVKDEPAYLDELGRIRHDAACWLFYQDIVFIDSGKMCFNLPKESEAPAFVADRDHYLLLILQLFNELAQDEDLMVPEEALHPLFRTGVPLNGGFLFNMQAFNQALAIQRDAEDHYTVLADCRLDEGIPDFPHLVARLIWKLRAHNGIARPFDVSFMGVVNFDANDYLGDSVHVNPVPGSVPLPSRLHVSSMPEVAIPSADELAEAARPWACGIENPTETQANEELFEGLLMTLCRSFPLTLAIEGTHHAGRAARIERVHVGDPLVLRADWESEFYDPCAIEVFDVDGGSLGYLREDGPGSAIAGNRGLACLLPYITATVESVTPLSKRRKNAKYALMDVRLELDPGIDPDGRRREFVDGVVRKAKALLAKPAAERAVCSRTASLRRAPAAVDSDASSPVKPVAIRDASPQGDPMLDGGVPGSVTPTGQLYAVSLVPGAPMPAADVDACIDICGRNVVTAEFYVATFDLALERALAAPAPEGALLARAVTAQAARALRAQKAKGAAAEEIQLMELEYEMVAEGLASASQPDGSGSELPEPDEAESIATSVADAVASVYWSPVIRLVRALTKVVAQKGAERREGELAAWQARFDALDAAAGDARGVLERAKAEREEAQQAVRAREADLERAERQGAVHAKLEAERGKLGDAAGRLRAAEAALEEARRHQGDVAKKISAAEAELSGLGMLAFSRKGTLRRELETLRAKERAGEGVLAKAEQAVSKLRKERERQEELERKLEELPADGTSVAAAQLARARDALARADSAVEAAAEAWRWRCVDLNEWRARRPGPWGQGDEDALTEPLRWWPAWVRFRS